MTELERQVERGSLFTHTALSEIAQSSYESRALVLGLIDVLLAAGVVTENAVSAAANKARDALDARGEGTAPGLSLRVDPPDPPVATVDCSARMHVCQAVCCKLRFALSAPEIEAGVVKWDLGQPYVIRHEPDGYCTHRDSGGCTVYDDRPQVCRSYSCAGDARIWADFDGMVLNQEWIDANLQEAGPALAYMAVTPVERFLSSEA
jgi:Fe-S-cluster containining protein